MYYCESAKKLLVLYNKKNNTKLTTKEFFNDVFVPLFYGDDISLMSVTNSPFYNLPANREKTIDVYKH